VVPKFAAFASTARANVGTMNHTANQRLAGVLIASEVRKVPDPMRRTAEPGRPFSASRRGRPQ
jgi:hypothetical protein